ncbi:MAG: ACT domain-containing protein [Collinsella sp.]
MDELQTKYYVRLKVADRVGALSETVDIFAKHNISISLINQVEDGKSGVSDACSVIFLTHRALEKDVRLPPPGLPVSTAWPRSPTSRVSRTSRPGPKVLWPTNPTLA